MASEYVEAALRHIREAYGVEPEYLWGDENAAFRHPEDKKWFAVLMPGVARAKLGQAREGRVDILDVKGDPMLIPSLIDGRGVLPGYHMNKAHWMTLTLDGAVPAEKLAGLIGMSYDLTRKRSPRRGKGQDEG